MYVCVYIYIYIYIHAHTYEQQTNQTWARAFAGPADRASGGLAAKSSQEEQVIVKVGRKKSNPHFGLINVPPLIFISP